MNYGSYKYNKEECRYIPLKKCIDNDLWERDMVGILKLLCYKYAPKKLVFAMDYENL